MSGDLEVSLDASAGSRETSSNSCGPKCAAIGGLVVAEAAPLRKMLRSPRLLMRRATVQRAKSGIPSRLSSNQDLACPVDAQRVAAHTSDIGFKASSRVVLGYGGRDLAA